MDYTFTATHSFTMCLTDFTDPYNRFCDTIEDYDYDVDFDAMSDDTRQKIFEFIILNAVRVHKGENVE